MYTQPVTITVGQQETGDQWWYRIGDGAGLCFEKSEPAFSSESEAESSARDFANRLGWPVAKYTKLNVRMNQNFTPATGA